MQTQNLKGYLWTTAKSVGSANTVWSKVFREKLANASPAAILVFKALKLWLATQKKNPDLALLSFSDVTTDAQTVPEVSTGGATIYGVYAKKQATATDAYFKFNDSATVAGGGSGANVKVTVPFLEIGDEVFMAFQPGLVFATGVIVASETTAAGGSDTTTGDGPNGFFIVG